MAQSEIQSLIQSLAGTHSAGQSNLPGAVNNGNPNTVYNTAPGYTPPVSDAFDTWRLSQPALPARDTSSIVGDPIAHANRFFQQSGTQLPAPVTRAPWTPPAGAGGATAPLPVFGNWNGSVGGGGLSTPPVIGTPGTGVIGTPSINLPEPPVQVGTGGNLPATPVTGGGTGTPSIMDQLSQAGIGLGTTAPSGQFGSALTGAVQPSSGAGSNIDWRQVLDAMSEPFLQGDLYLNNMNSWDTSNILAALGQSLTGLDFNSGMNMIGKYLEGQGYSNFLTDHFLDNDVNATQGMYNDMLASGEISNSPTGWLGDLAPVSGSPYSIGNNLDSMLWGGVVSPISGTTLGTTPFSNPYSNAGTGTNTAGQNAVEQAFGLPAGSLASTPSLSSGGGGGARSAFMGTNTPLTADQIAANQEAFRAMQLASMGVKQTGGDIYGNMYEK